MPNIGSVWKAKASKQEKAAVQQDKTRQEEWHFMQDFQTSSVLSEGNIQQLSRNRTQQELLNSNIRRQDKQLKASCKKRQELLKKQHQRAK